MANSRAGRVEKRILQTVASMLRGRVKDPRVEPVTITDVKVTGDLQHATVYYTVLGDQYVADDAGRGLKAATGMIRSEVGHQLGLRLTPTLEFVRDELPDTVRSFEELLSEARRRDEELAKHRGSTYAGDPDPYRKPREVTDAGVEAGSAPANAPADWDAGSAAPAHEQGVSEAVENDTSAQER